MNAGSASGVTWSDELFVLLLADLCHPRSIRRESAAGLLSQLLPEHAEMLRNRARCSVDRAYLLERLLDLRGITLEAAATHLSETLRVALRNATAAPEPGLRVRAEKTLAEALVPIGARLRFRAAAALGVMGYRPAIPLLLPLLRGADPEEYTTIVRALARLEAPEVVPILVAFTMPAWEACGFDAVGLDADTQADLTSLLRASRWLERESRPSGAWLSGDPTNELRLSEHQAHARAAFYERLEADRESLIFAADMLWNMGEVDLLRAARQLSSADASGIRANPDPRLFEALVVALAHRPRGEGERCVCLAAVEGLEALGEPRCLAVLEAFAGRWAAGPNREITIACRSAAARVQERLASERREVTPSEAPGGAGSEVAPGSCSTTTP